MQPGDQRLITGLFVHELFKRKIHRHDDSSVSSHILSPEPHLRQRQKHHGGVMSRTLNVFDELHNSLSLLYNPQHS